MAWIWCAGSGTAAYQDGAAGLARFNFPRGVALDGSGASGAAPPIYVADTLNARIRVVFGGMVSSLAGNGAAGASNGACLLQASFNGAIAVTADPEGNLYIAEWESSWVRKVTRVAP
jgi:hypothetical protein